MLLRLKGTLTFTTQTARNAFATKVGDKKTGQTVVKNACAKVDSLSYYLDIAFVNETGIRAWFDELKADAKTTITTMKVYVHTCRLEAGDPHQISVQGYEAYIYG